MSRRGFGVFKDEVNSGSSYSAILDQNSSEDLTFFRTAVLKVRILLFRNIQIRSQSDVRYSLCLLCNLKRIV